MGTKMAWLILLLAGATEIIWALGLKYSAGFTKPLIAAVTVFFAVLSVLLLGIALKKLPLSSAYGTWVGIGFVGTAVAGVLLFNESMSSLKIISLLLIIGGIGGLFAAEQL